MPQRRKRTEKNEKPPKNYQLHVRRSLGEGGSTKNSLQWLIKKDKAALRMVATASASGWVSKNSAAKWLWRGISFCASAGRKFLPEKKSGWGAAKQIFCCWAATGGSIAMGGGGRWVPSWSG